MMNLKNIDSEFIITLNTQNFALKKLRNIFLCVIALRLRVKYFFFLKDIKN